MRALNDKEKRTLRIAIIIVGAYLCVFFGLRGHAYFQQKSLEYQAVLARAQKLQSDMQMYSDKADKAKKLMENYHMDPAKLSPASVVAGASAAIQKAAQSGGVTLGPIREVQGRASAQEIASVQLEGSGPASSLMAFLGKLETLGYPLIIDRIQITAAPNQPNMVKLSLTIVILDFEKWRAAEGPNV